jgi:hypothetical protein
MTKRSNAVDEAIKRSWAKLAAHAFKRAVAKLDFDKPQEAEAYIYRVERWLDKAGARATDYYFN